MFSDVSDQTRRMAIAFVSSSLRLDAILQFFFVIIAFAFAHHLLFITNRPNGPPMVRGSLPFLGVALSFLHDPEQFLLKCQKRYGDIFTLYMGGKRLHVVCDSVNGIPSVYRNFKTFPFSVLANHFDIILFGVSEKQAKDTALYKAHFDRLAPSLLAQNMVDRLIENFNMNLQPILAREIHKLDAGGQLSRDGVVIDLDAWLKKIMFECSGKALFGETWPSEDQFFEDYSQWDSGIYDILKGYPNIMTRKAVQARERYYKRLVEMFRKPLINPSKLIEERVEVLPFIEIRLTID